MNKPEAIKDAHVFAPETLVDPFDYYRAIHDAGIDIEHLPDMNTYVVYSYDLCNQVNAQPEVYSNDFSSLMGREADEEIQAILAEGWPGDALSGSRDAVAPRWSRRRQPARAAVGLTRGPRLPRHRRP